jgi:hypothetical protein
MWRLLMRHRLVTGAGVLVLLGVFVLVWFQPQKLFIDKTVDEALPPMAAEATNNPAAPTPQPSQPDVPKPVPGVVSRGSFISRGHGTSGNATIYRESSGTLLLRLDNLDTSNGPDLRVRLSRRDIHASNGDINDGALDLGSLKGNRGSQNYQIPTGTDLSPYQSVIIWCRRFTYVFGAAPLTH